MNGKWIALLFWIFFAVIQTGCEQGEIDEDQVTPPSTTPVLAIAPFSVLENSTNSFLFTLSRPSPQPVTFNWGISAISVSPSSRFSALSGSVTIPAGATAYPVVIPLVNDSIYQQNQDFKLTLTNVSTSIELPANQIQFTLVDDEAPPTIRFATASQSVAEASGSASVVLELSHPSIFTTTVGYTLSGTATQGADYSVTPTSSVTFAPGETSKTLIVALQNDAISEPDETVEFGLGLILMGQAIKSTTQGSHTLTIANDDFAPTVTQINSTKPNGYYGSGSVPITVQFSQAVTVTGTPTLTLETGLTDRIANYVSGSGTTNLVFNYAIQPGDTSADLDVVSTTALALAGGSIKSVADSLDADLALPSPGSANSLGANKDIAIDTVVPVVTQVSSSSMNGSYSINATLSVTVMFSKTITVVSGAPRLALETGVTDRFAPYASGSGTSSLTFTYTVQAGDTSDDLDYVSASALELNGATLRDRASNAPNLTLADPGTSGSLSWVKNLLIDTTPATVVAVGSSVASGSYTVGAVIPVEVVFSESVFVSGTPRLTLETGSVDRAVDYVSGSGSNKLVFNYTVQAGDSAAPLDVKSNSSLILNSGSILDRAANASVLTLPSPGASGSLADSKTILIDTNGPSVSSLASSSANGAYRVGAVLPIQVFFTEPVIVVGTTQLTLETGLTDRIVNYTSGSGTSTLTFNYTVQAGDTSSDLDVVTTSSLALNSGSIKDAAGNSSALTLPAPGAPNSLSSNKNIVIDTTAPSLVGVSSPLANGAYKAGTDVPVTVQFSEAVYLTGTPQLVLKTSPSSTTTVSYTGGSGTPTLEFTYTVQAGDTSFDLDYELSTSFSLNGGSLADLAGNTAPTELPSPGTAGSLGANKNIVIDTSAPTVLNVTSSKANGGYKAGTLIPIQIVFSEAVVVTGTPKLVLETGTTDRSATYASGSGTSTLTFNYTVQPGDSASDLDYKSTTSLQTAGGSIADPALNAAVLTLASPGTAGSLGANKALVIDTEIPVVTSVTSLKADGYYRAGETVSILVNFSKPVFVSGTPLLTLETGGTDRDISYASGTGTTQLSFTYTVQSADTSSDLDYTSTSALMLNGGSIEDAVTNPATLTLPSPGAAGSLSQGKSLVIDTTVPTAPTSMDDGTWSLAISTTPTLSWSAASDLTSGIDHYELAVGTSSGSTNTLPWTNAGPVTSKVQAGLSLTEGTLYFVSVRAVDRAGNISAITSGDGFRADVTAPTTPSTLDDGLTSASLTQSPALAWSASTDALSGISRYEVAIGSSSGATDVLNWTNVGAVTTNTLTGLTLVEGSTYFASVRVYDRAGNVSAARPGDGWVIGWLQQAYLKASNQTSGNALGSSVAISGDTMVVGAPLKDSSQGSVYVYVRSGSSWTQQAVIKSANAQNGDLFGNSVAISGDTLVIGSPGDSCNNSSVSTSTSCLFAWTNGSGAAHVYIRSGTTWSLQAYMKASNRDSNDDFGRAVAISGNTIVIGAPQESSNATGVSTSDSSNNSSSQAGAAYVFTRSGNTWTQSTYLKQAFVRAGVKFGSSVAINLDTIVVGAPVDQSSGAAYVFKRVTAWSQEAYLKASPVVSGMQFGASVSVDGDVAIVGAPNETTNTGSAFVFARSGSTWSQQTALRALNATTGYLFGTSVSINGDLVLVGSPGEAALETNVIQGNDVSYSTSAPSSGAAYLYRKNGNSWPQLAYLKAPNAQANDNFGVAVSISNSSLGVGATGEDSNQKTVTNGQTASSDNSAADSGAVYLFNR